MEKQDEEAKTPKTGDQRRVLRYPIIILKVTEERKKEHLFGYAKNISRSGLYIQSVNPRQPGEQFTISFLIPNTEIRVRCQCEVVWMRKYHPKISVEPGYGVRFLDLSTGVADAIDQWIKQKI
ncbi:MAG TPA: PilZ domain-containing protein [Nitrospiria bacterium]